MNIRISNEAIDWFAEEMDAESGDAIKFFPRYGGSSKLHTGFSLGVMKEDSDKAAVEVTESGVRYYIEESDLWYFDGHDLHVSVDSEQNELQFDYVQST